ncbi:phosphate ABC transporter substrate-binding protein PstS [Aestuariimicrobium ganziense]|uniref:phosphate ABC transporter substrate-binding protein PstS n=1 Tax=Aestuariimicrobium ganziense TaxID=2773677 RepID=UPI001F21BCBB|nr:phosphate ABC transporter substrate-binding protein PstS [Aestuariimicrobium ganziense]
MNIKKIGAPFAILMAAALSMSACAANEGTPADNATTQSSGSADAGSNLSGTLAGQGASSMSVAQQTWIAEFQKKNSGVTINYSPDGSGAGRKAFQGGGVQFAGSDRAFKDEEMKAGSFGKCTAESNALNLPVYISPIAVIYKVDGVDELKLDPDTLAGIFAGKITKWNDPKIAATNEGVTLPDATITAVHRSDDSGTTENFTDYLSQAAPSVWTEKANGEWPSAFGGEAAKGTAGVVDAVTQGKNTIGYADASQAGDLGVAKVKVGEEFLGPDADKAAKLVEASPKVEGRKDHDWALKLDRKAQGAYPIALVAYALVCEDYKDDKDAELVKAYVGYMVSDEGQKVAHEKVGSAPLSADMQAKMKAAVDSIK